MKITKQAISRSYSCIGFTLIELVVTISIILILSVISAPLFVSRNADAKLAEGYALLGAIMNAQKCYYEEYGNFLWGAHSSHGSGGYSPVETVLGINAYNNRYFTCFCVDTHGWGSNAKDATIVVKSSKNGTLSVALNVGKHSEIIYTKPK